jgi:hypothetical protein
MVKLERSLEAEVKRRADADRQMQAHFDEEVKGISERVAAQYAELSGSFRTSVEGLARTLQDLHAIVKWGGGLRGGAGRGGALMCCGGGCWRGGGV